MSTLTKFEFMSEQFTPNNLVWRDLSGKVVVVTGSNTGLGLGAVRHFATMKPAKLIMAVRDEKKGKAAADDVEATTGFRPEVWILDLGSFFSVRNFARRFNDSTLRLDILVSNAGIAASTWNNTKDGFEATLQTNHLSNMLLIHQLLPALRMTATKHNVEPRIVVVASDVHFWTKYPQGKFADPIAALNDPSRSDIKDRYLVSKLLNVFMTRQFAKFFSENGDKISIQALNPGWCYSELARNRGFVDKIVTGVIMYFVAKSTEDGCRTLVHAALSENLLLENGPGGRYWSVCKEKCPSPTGVDDKFAATVWKESMDILKPHLAVVEL